MRRTYKQLAALAGAAAIGALGASATPASAASSNPFACDASASRDGAAMIVPIVRDRVASIPVPRPCFPDGAEITAHTDNGNVQNDRSVVTRGPFVNYIADRGTEGRVVLRFTAPGQREQRVNVLVGSPQANREVYAIGDSVTAGFGYCGPGDVCGPSDAPVKDSWMSLSDCNQEAEWPKLPENFCSNNRRGGVPWLNGGELAGSIAYPFQFREWLRAGSQGVIDRAPTVRNWGVSGARPAHWDAETIYNDPTNKHYPGGFSGQTKTIRDSLVMMTLGANKLLADFLQFDFSGPVSWFGDTTGDYAKCTGTRGWFWGYDEAHHARLKRCFDEDWSKNNQSEHLVNVYRQLLSQGNKVMVLGYHLACPSTFGTWQTMEFFGGPSAAKPCTSMEGDDGLSQWDQAVYVSGLLNDEIRAAVERASQWARANGRDGSIAFVDTAWLDDWKGHQTWHREPWVFPNDTGIHPSRRGHSVMAKNVANEACYQFGVFCAQRAVVNPEVFTFPGRYGKAASADRVVAGSNVTAAAAARRVANRTVVARVGSTEITAGEVRRMGRALGDDASDPSSATADEALKTLITGAQVRAEARRLGIPWPRGRELVRATRRFSGEGAGHRFAAQHRYVTVSAILAHEVGDRLVGAPRFPSVAEGRAYARRHWRAIDHTRLTNASAREALYDDRAEIKRERVQTLVDRRYRRVTRCTSAAAGNPACRTQHGAWVW